MRFRRGRSSGFKRRGGFRRRRSTFGRRPMRLRIGGRM